VYGDWMSVEPNVFRHVVDVCQRNCDFSQVVGHVQEMFIDIDDFQSHTVPQ